MTNKADVLAEALEQAKQWQLGMVTVRQPEGYTAVVEPHVISTVFRTLLEACAAYQAFQLEGEGAEWPTEEQVERAAWAIHEARYKGPKRFVAPPSLSDPGDVEYCYRLARAALAAAPVPPAQPPASQWR